VRRAALPAALFVAGAGSLQAHHLRASGKHAASASTQKRKKNGFFDDDFFFLFSFVGLTRRTLLAVAMMFGIVLLLSLAAVARSSSESSSSDNFLDRLDLKNFKSVESQRTDTSTSSSDESSDASRVARAVEAALKEADLAERLAATRRDSGLRFRPDNSGLFRLRLSTTNRANTCSFFACGDTSAPTQAADVSLLEGTTVTATLVGGATRSGKFNAAGLAENTDDIIGAFKVQAAVAGAGFSFVLSTLNTDKGLNITSVRLTSGVGPKPTTRRVTFDPLSNLFWNADTRLAVNNPNVTVTPGTAAIGCDATFDGFDSRGFTSFTVAVDTSRQATLASNTSLTSFTFATNAFEITVNTGDSEILGELALDTLPCASRSSVTYDDIIVATVEPTAELGFVSSHPLIYDALRAKALTNLASSSDTLVRELQQAAGRTQIVLRDVMLDRGAFNLLSHTSKYTSCFRALPNEIDQIEVYIGMVSSVGTDGIVRASAEFDNGGDDDGQLTTDKDGSLVFRDVDDTLSLGAALDDVKFTVNELIFSNLGQTFAPKDFVDFDGPPPFEGTSTRPYAVLPSDVTVRFEPCPSFNYFN
jgi:hypothetical protein